MMTTDERPHFILQAMVAILKSKQSVVIERHSLAAVKQQRL